MGAVEINISSPNTAGLVVFQEPAALSELLDRVNDGRRKPVFVKLPPYLAGDESEDRDRAINACGGIFSGEDALLALHAGATTV